MLGTIVENDEAAMTVSLRKPNGALFLFDFKAAFPSESFGYLFTCLEEEGMLREELNLVKMLYHNNKCVISLKGSTYAEFGTSTGIRQGCPLSALSSLIQSTCSSGDSRTSTCRT